MKQFLVRPLNKNEASQCCVREMNDCATVFLSILVCSTYNAESKNLLQSSNRKGEKM